MDDKIPPVTDANPPNERSADALRALHDRMQSALAAQRARMSELEARLTDQLDLISRTLEDQSAAHAEKMDQVRQSSLESDHLRRELEMAQVAWHAEHEHQVNEIAQCREELDQRKVKLDALAAELDSTRSQHELRQQALDRRSSELDDRQRKLDDLAHALEVRENELGPLEGGTSEAQRKAEETARKLQQERDELAAREAALRASQQQLEHDQQELATRQQAWEAERSALDGERSELQQKFELAIEDVQRLRSRVTELEQELAARPVAPDQSDSVELVHLRAERDALAARVEELERQAVAPIDGDNAQEVADLQRRFELAVEDVRDLKKKNSQLEAELAEARTRGGVAGSTGDSGSAGWELLKKQMLADLEGEGLDDIDEHREKERATIESTIRITDEVVANKDREIAELKSQLATTDRPSAEEEKIREIVDADEIIQQHRAKIAQLEQEMEEKLRAAELELSVERAKLARERNQLDDLRAELESQKAQGNYGDGGAAQNHSPKRRWLSKLGLAGDDEGK